MSLMILFIFFKVKKLFSDWKIWLIQNAVKNAAELIFDILISLNDRNYKERRSYLTFSTSQ